MADFARAVRHEPFILFEGAVIERLRRDPAVRLDPHVLHTGLVYDPEGRAALERVYRSYLDVGRTYSLPMVVLTPTWRANAESVRRAGLGDFVRVNHDAVRFLAQIRDSYAEDGAPIWIAGLVGSRGDAYKPEQALDAAEAARFHAPQALALAEAGVDLLMAATLPALSEAVGLARALAATGLPYILSFVIRPTGTLLDGTPLHRAVEQIDTAGHATPIAYMINCVHPSVFEQALRHETDRAPWLRTRMLGLQANTSPKSPEELDNAPHLETEMPGTFADAMIRLHTELGIEALGGCCGTDHRHITHIARRAALLTAAAR
jgi:homocysteine S-methyltransferase